MSQLSKKVVLFFYVEPKECVEQGLSSFKHTMSCSSVPMNALTGDISLRSSSTLDSSQYERMSLHTGASGEKLSLFDLTKQSPRTITKQQNGSRLPSGLCV